MRLLSLFLLSFFSLCSSNIFAQKAANINGPHWLVYKTRADYSHLVPVILSDDKKSIVSYPAPKDLERGKGYALPTQLHKGYLLDRRGISKNVAFLKLTYEEYTKLSSPPAIADMMNLIIDKDPLISLCDCGLQSKYHKPVQEINSLIDAKWLRKTCKKIK